MKINQCNNRVTTPFGDFQLDVDNLFDHVFGERPKAAKPADWTPRVTVNETETSYDLVMELPGIDPSQVAIEAKDNQLEISGSRVAAEPTEGVKTLRNERLHGTFNRKFEFKQAVNNDAITADFKHGLLSITLPKSETALPKKIEIKVAD